jgi:hypothetical protein
LLPLDVAATQKKTSSTPPPSPAPAVASWIPSASTSIGTNDGGEFLALIGARSCTLSRAGALVRACVAVASVDETVRTTASSLSEVQRLCDAKSFEGKLLQSGVAVLMQKCFQAYRKEVQDRPI